MKANELFRNQLATCDRPGLRGRVLTLACEVPAGKRARAWRCEWVSEWVDMHGVKHITRRFEWLPEWELQPLDEEIAA